MSLGLGLKLGLSRQQSAINRIVYSLLAALNASNTAPLTSLVGTDLTQTATSPVVIPAPTSLITLPAGYPAVPGATYTWDTAQGATLGAELITDGDFSGSSWLTQAGWSESGGFGVATAAPSANAIYQNNIATQEKKYRITYTIVEITGGAFRCAIGSIVGASRATAGTYTEDLTASSVLWAGVVVSGTTSGTIDNYSIKEITPAVLAPGLSETATVLASGLTRYTGGPAGVNPSLGILAEVASTNKLTSHKAVPTVTTNATVAGGGTTPATLTLAADTTALTTAGIRGICTGNVFKLDNSAGDATATVTFGGTTANTNKHSLSLWARKASGAGSSSFALTSGTGATAISSAAYSRLKSENLTPSGTTQQMVITAGIGDVLWFILPQMEEQIIATSEIFAATETTAAVTRAARFNPLTGSELGSKITIDATPYELGREQYLLGGTTGKIYQGSDNKIYATDGTTTLVSTSLMVANTTAIIGVDFAGGKLYFNGTQEDSDVAMSPTWGAAPNLGATSAGGSVFNGTLSVLQSSSDANFNAGSTL